MSDEINEQKASTEELTEAVQALVEANRENSVELNRQKENLEDLIQKSDSAIVKAEARKLLQETIVELRKAELRELQKQLQTTGQISEEEAKKLKLLQQQNKIAENAPEFISNLFTAKGGDQITKSISGIGTSIKNELTNNFKSAIFSGDKMGASLKAAVGPAAALAVLALVTEIAKLAVELFDAEAGFMKATGASEEFARSISNSYEETRRFGATAAETSAAMQSLFTGFSEFTFQDQKTREGFS